jgi:hypothetical protein
MKREEIWKSLEKIQISANLLIKVKNTYNRTTNCVKKIRGDQHGLRQDLELDKEVYYH